jgi:hypothetical protein
VRDFRARIAHYEGVYEPVDDPRLLRQAGRRGRQVELNRIHGYLPAASCRFLMNLHITRRPIWLTRHGESVFNSSVSSAATLAQPARRGVREEPRRLRARQLPREASMIVWTSTMQRTVQTAQHLTRKPRAWRALDEIDAGVCDGMTYEQIAADMPDVHAAASPTSSATATPAASPTKT